MCGKTAEQQNKIKKLLKVITDISPDAKKMLDDKQKDIEYWTERSREVAAQMHKLSPRLRQII